MHPPGRPEPAAGAGVFLPHSRLQSATAAAYLARYTGTSRMHAETGRGQVVAPDSACSTASAESVSSSLISARRRLVLSNRGLYRLSCAGLSVRVTVLAPILRIHDGRAVQVDGVAVAAAPGRAAAGHALDQPAGQASTRQPSRDDPITTPPTAAAATCLRRRNARPPGIICRRLQITAVSGRAGSSAIR